MYSLKYSNWAEKALKRIDHHITIQIYHSLEKIREDPYKYIETMKVPKHGHSLYKYRIEDYRVVISMQDQDLVILVIDAGHRRSIYKKYGGKG